MFNFFYILTNMDDVILKKSKYVEKSLIDDLLIQVSSIDGDNTFYIKSDITIMKELSGRPDKFTPVQADAINARATMSPPTHDGTVEPDEVMRNIVPRDAQTLVERQKVAEYFANQVVDSDKKRREDEEMNSLRESIINPKTD